MRIYWTDPAKRHLEEIEAYITADNPLAAIDVVMLILSVTSRTLSFHPYAGKKGRVEGTRELLIPGLPYIVAYRPIADRLEILAVIHTARRWPHRFNP